MAEHRHSPTGLPSPGESTSLLALLEQEFIDLSNEIADKLSGWSFFQSRRVHLANQVPQRKPRSCWTGLAFNFTFSTS